MQGCYRDQLTDLRQRVVWDSGWRDNTITHTAWVLLAALVGNHPSMQGALFCAVGAGESDWDQTLPLPDPAATRLRAERERHALTTEDFSYLDIRGSAAQVPTNRLEIRAQFPASDVRRVLREFGLVGGNATAAADSGYLINYVVHPRLDLRAGVTLTRRVRLTLRPGSGRSRDGPGLPPHWLLHESPRLLDGVGEAYAAALAGIEVNTIGALAEAEPARLARAVPLAKAVELQAKARLSIRTAYELVSVPSSVGRTPWEVITTPLPARDWDDDVSPATLETLREQMSVLQLALDARYLRHITIGELARKRES
jgi:hypothetical protein